MRWTAPFGFVDKETEHTIEERDGVFLWFFRDKSKELKATIHIEDSDLLNEMIDTLVKARQALVKKNTARYVKKKKSDSSD